MPPEILALIDKPLSLAVLLFFGALIGITVEQIASKQRRDAWKRRNQGGWRKSGSARPGSAPQQFAAAIHPLPTVDAADQLRDVMAAAFEKKPLLNKSEARVFFAAERAVKEANQGWRLMAQVSLGEVLRSPDDKARRAINSKRVDFLIIGPGGEPLAAIEYQGGGHHQGTAAARDAVKKEALRRAGVEYIEVKAGEFEADLKFAISKLTRGTRSRRVATD